MERRTFLAAGLTTGAAALGGLFDFATPACALDTGGGIGIEEGLHLLEGGKEKNITPAIRPEIADRPRAVFLIETRVDASPDSRGFYTDARMQLEETGKRIVPWIFVCGSKRGGSTVIAPNFTTVQDSVLSPVQLMYSEMWCQRAVDSAFAVRPHIYIIEGIIGREGNGFNIGTDHLCNFIVIGLSKLEVDSVASYLMGQNPLELHYTRIGKERGLGENDPEKIEINWIRDGEIVPLRRLSELRRIPLGVNIFGAKDPGERLFW